MMVLAHVPVCQMHLNNKSRLVYLIFSLMENSNNNESISLHKYFCTRLRKLIQVVYLCSFSFGRKLMKKILCIIHYSICKFKFKGNDIPSRIFCYLINMELSFKLWLKKAEFNKHVLQIYFLLI